MSNDDYIACKWRKYVNLLTLVAFILLRLLFEKLFLMETNTVVNLLCFCWLLFLCEIIFSTFSLAQRKSNKEGPIFQSPLLIRFILLWWAASNSPVFHCSFQFHSELPANRYHLVLCCSPFHSRAGSAHNVLIFNPELLNGLQHTWPCN